MRASMLRAHLPAPADTPTSATPDDALLPPYEQVAQAPAPPYFASAPSPKSAPFAPVEIRWSDVSHTAAERRGVGSLPNLIHTVVPFTLLLLRILSSVAVLLVRLAGLSLSQLLGIIHQTLARLDNANTPAFGHAHRARPSTDCDSISSDETLTHPNRRQRFRAASALDESTSLQHLLRSARPHDEVYIHHHHHHHPSSYSRPDSRCMSESALGLSFDALPSPSPGSVDTDDDDGDDDDDSTHMEEVTPRQSSDSTTPHVRGIDEYEEPQDAFARKLARLALRAQAELDVRLARGEISADGSLSPLHVDSESESDFSAAESAPQAHETVSFISSDSSTPLSDKPMTVPMRGRSGVVAPHSLSSSQASPLGTDASHWAMPLDELLAPSTAPCSGTRRASAPASILQRSTGSSSSAGAVSECRSPSELDSTINGSQGSSSAGRKVKLVEPNWEPYVESHVRARARVQLSTLLQAARAEQGRQSLRNNLRVQALSAHAVHTEMHAQLHAQAHTQSHDNGVALDEASIASDKTETETQVDRLEAQPMERIRSSSFTSAGSLGSASVSTATSSLSPAPASSEPTEDSPQLFFESLFPGTAASKEWDFRKKPPGKGPPLDALADLLFDPMTRGGDSHRRRHKHQRRSASSRILSRAGAASAVLQARTTGMVPCSPTSASMAGLPAPLPRTLAGRRAWSAADSFEPGVLPEEPEEPLTVTLPPRASSSHHRHGSHHGHGHHAHGRRHRHHG